MSFAVMPRSRGLLSGSLLSSKYSFTRPTVACQTRNCTVRPGSSSPTRSQPSSGRITGSTGIAAGSL